MQVAMVLYRWNCFCIGGILSALAFHRLAMMLVHRGTDYIPNPIDIYERKANWRHVSKR